MVNLNSAAALIVARKTDNYKQAAILAADAIDSGAALNALNNLISINNGTVN